MNRISDAINYYVSSFLYPLSLAVIAYIGWITQAFWIAAGLESLLCFAPLFGDDGRGYEAPPLCVLPLVSERLSFNNIQPYMYLAIACYILSLLLFLIIRRPKFKPGNLFYPYMILSAVFLISNIANSIETDTFEYEAYLFIFLMILIVGESALFGSVLEENKDSFRYLAWCIVAMSILISIEVFSYYIMNPDKLYQEGAEFGWAGSKPMVSTLLVSSLPFYGILIYRSRKNIVYLFMMFFPIIANILLGTESGLLAMVLSFLPIILLSFRSYGRSYPYISLILSLVFVGLLGFYIGFSASFQKLFVASIKSLNLMDSDSSSIYQYVLAGFEKSLILGPSAQGLVSIFSVGPGQLFIPRNTVLTTAYMGGIVGLVAYVPAWLMSYWVCLNRKSPDRWLLLVFLLMTDLIGITDNTIYNLYFLMFFLAIMASYQSSNIYTKANVTDKYFNEYDQALIR